jgi:hypothetical protein
MMKITDLGKFHVLVSEHGRVVAVGELLEKIAIMDEIGEYLRSQKWFLLECLDGGMFAEFEVEVNV